jgi:hypothetical protein
VGELVRYGEQLSGEDPWADLVAWLRRFVTHMGTKHVLLAVLTRQKAYQPPRAALYSVAGPLLERAQHAHAARTDVDIDDILRVIFGLTGGVYRDDAQRERAVQIVLDGIHTPASRARAAG